MAQNGNSEVFLGSLVRRIFFEYDPATDVTNPVKPSEVDAIIDRLDFVCADTRTLGTMPNGEIGLIGIKVWGCVSRKYGESVVDGKDWPDEERLYIPLLISKLKEGKKVDAITILIT